MVSTHLASFSDPCRPTPRDSRCRVDPMKLLDLIARIQSARGGTPAEAGAAARPPSAKTG